MEIAIKLGDARLPTHPAYEKNWLDGQPIEARWDGFKWGKKDREDFLIIRTIDDFWQVRGGSDWKVWNPQAVEFLKLFSVRDSAGKFQWEFGSVRNDEKRVRMRDRFIDINALLNAKTITKAYYDKLYIRGEEAGILNLPVSLFDILKHEGIDQRAVEIKNQGITSGIYQIGTGGGADYATVALFATAVNEGGQLDGDLTGEHQNEETAISAYVTFDVDTNGFLLKLTAESGAEHNGGAYGNGARIAYGGTNATIEFDETNQGDLDDIEISNLALDASVNTDGGLVLTDGGNTGMWTINRLLIKGAANCKCGLYMLSGCRNVLITNNIIYDFGNGPTTVGIRLALSATTSLSATVYNNTVIGCYDGIVQDRDVAISYALIVKNNIVQNSGNVDYRDDGGGFGTTGQNISEDDTSPDAAYRNMNLHDGNSCFVDYDNDDYRLISTGDEIGDLP